MVQYQLKLKLTPKQERELLRWVRHLGAVWNWAIKKIERDAGDGIYYSSVSFRDVLKGYGPKLDIPQDAISGTLWTAHNAWQLCFRKQSGKPRLKGRRNKLNSIAFAHGTRLHGDKVLIPKLGRLRFHRQFLPAGHIGQMRVVKRASGWYACLFIDAEASAIPRIANNQVGMDPGFSSLLTLSTGEKITHPRELEASALRLAQAQRGKHRKLAARISERIASQRKDRNHKLSRRLVSENQMIAFSKDNTKGMARRFGKSVASSGHYQLRRMLEYKSKCRTGGSCTYVEPDSRNSTITCSACGALTGPRGWAGLKVREWDCGACGAHHDRDVNAAVNTLIAGAGLAHEMSARAA